MIELIDVVADAGKRLERAAQAIGGTINFDPTVALSRDAALNLGPPGNFSPNGQCRLIETQDGWIAVNLAREEDRHSVPAWTGAAVDGDIWDEIIATARRKTKGDLLAQAIQLHLPISCVGEARAFPQPQLQQAQRTRPTPPQVIDLSALWAGPYCGGLLAEAGLNVIRVESPARPDPTPLSSPMLDHRLNGRKQRMMMTLDSPVLIEMIAAADILITSARPHALNRIGLSQAALFAANPSLIWIAITAHGWHDEEAAIRVGFGDDCAAAGGLVRWHGETPQFMGDALADPLTGLTAATLALEAMAADQCGLIDVALAPVAATFAKALQ